MQILKDELMDFYTMKGQWLLRLSFFFFMCSNCYALTPELFLLRTYKGSQDLTGWVMSEKLDGVRAYWDGHQLISRGGNVFNAPQSFLQNFPPFALDGELWTKRNNFENIVSIVRQHKPDERWSQIHYQVFEVPHQKGGLYERLSVLKVYLESATNLVANKLIPIQIVPQFKIKNKTHLNDFFQQIVSQGGEGVVLRNPVEGYQTGRLGSALKLKAHQDEDCEVTGYKLGRGKYQGMVGSLKCQLKNQKTISVGSGLSDQQRQYPPKIGSIITFKYYGLTGRGLPRFPVFLRERVFAVDDK
jgi:DNA ligase-1